MLDMGDLAMEAITSQLKEVEDHVDTGATTHMAVSKELLLTREE
jgi:hypothetical protein